MSYSQGSLTNAPNPWGYLRELSSWGLAQQPTDML